MSVKYDLARLLRQTLTLVALVALAIGMGSRPANAQLTASVTAVTGGFDCDASGTFPGNGEPWAWAIYVDDVYNTGVFTSFTGSIVTVDVGQFVSTSGLAKGNHTITFDGVLYENGTPTFLPLGGGATWDFYELPFTIP